MRKLYVDVDRRGAFARQSARADRRGAAGRVRRRSIEPIKSPLGAQALGWYRLERGEFDDAARWFKNALDWWPPQRNELSQRLSVRRPTTTSRSSPSSRSPARIIGARRCAFASTTSAPIGKPRAYVNTPEGFAKTEEGYARTLARARPVRGGRGHRLGLARPLAGPAPPVPRNRRRGDERQGRREDFRRAPATATPRRSRTRAPRRRRPRWRGASSAPRRPKRRRAGSRRRWRGRRRDARSRAGRGLCRGAAGAEEVRRGRQARRALARRLAALRSHLSAKRSAGAARRRRRRADGERQIRRHRRARSRRPIPARARCRSAGSPTRRRITRARSTWFHNAVAWGGDARPRARKASRCRCARSTASRNSPLSATPNAAAPAVRDVYYGGMIAWLTGRQAGARGQSGGAALVRGGRRRGSQRRSARRRSAGASIAARQGGGRAALVRERRRLERLRSARRSAETGRRADQTGRGLRAGFARPPAISVAARMSPMSGATRARRSPGFTCKSSPRRSPTTRRF